MKRDELQSLRDSAQLLESAGHFALAEQIRDVADGLTPEPEPEPIRPGRWPYTMFGKTRQVDSFIYENGVLSPNQTTPPVDSDWVERPEDWYGMPHWKRRTLVVQRSEWIDADPETREMDEMMQRPYAEFEAWRRSKYGGSQT